MVKITEEPWFVARKASLILFGRTKGVNTTELVPQVEYRICATANAPNSLASNFMVHIANRTLISPVRRIPPDREVGPAGICLRLLADGATPKRRTRSRGPAGRRADRRKRMAAVVVAHVGPDYGDNLLVEFL